MKPFLFFYIFLLHASCIQSSNTNSFDRDLSQFNDIDTSTPGGQRLFDAFDIIKDRCISCHNSYHNSWSSFNNNQKWKNSQLIEVGNAFNSNLIIKTKNIGGNMPLDNPQISEEEFDKIVNWIDNIDDI